MQKRHLLTLALPFLIALGACGEDRKSGGSSGTEGEGEGEGPGEGEGEGEGPAEGEGEGPAEGEGEGGTELCDGTPDVDPGADVCAVEAGGDGLAIVGDVLTPGQVYEGGAVVLDASGIITCVGCGCDLGSATKVVCPDAVVSPGLINMHDHMGWMGDPPFDPVAQDIDPKLRWEHRHDWRRGKRGNPAIDVEGQATKPEREWGELRFVIGGATSINGSGSSSGLVRNVDGNRGGEDFMLPQLERPAARYDTFPLDDAGASLRSHDCDYGDKYKAGDKDPPRSIPYTFHISEGIDPEARNEFLCLTSTDRGGRDVLNDRVGIIHAIGLLAADVALIAQREMRLIWSPRTNISLYGDTAPVTLFHTFGVPIGLGTDWMPSGSMNMLRELKCVDSLNQNNYGGWFSDQDIWKMVTQWGAESIHLDDAIGVLAPARVGDISVFANNGRRLHRAIIDANPGDVALVLRGGDVLYGNANVVAALEDGCDEMGDVCGSDKRVCLQREIGKSFSALQGEVGQGNYGLFFCDDPPKEPSCLPARQLAGDSIDGSTLYAGMSVEDDADGDGVPDADDTCPAVFNPVRPVDGGNQADYDCDGQGDVCDLTPLGDDPSTPRPSDLDCDLVADDADNCPATANEGQADGDGDGKGDVCDACPDYANPGAQGCLSTIWAVKGDRDMVGERVELLNLVVTAVAENGVFLQADPDADGYQGIEGSGVWVYMGSDDKPAQWDVIRALSAEVADFYGQTELADLEWEKVGVHEPIAPHVLGADGLCQATQDAARSPFEGVLVRVEGVGVTNTAPEAGAGDDGENEFEVDCGLRVDDKLFLIDPPPADGERFGFLAGPLMFANQYLKLLPRGDADVGFAAASLVSFGPESAFSRVDREGDTFPEPLVLELARPVAEPVEVTISSSDEDVAVVPDGAVEVGVGGRTATVTVRGVGAGTATLSARIDAEDDPLEVEVRVLATDEAATLVGVEPAEVIAPLAMPVEIGVLLDIPAPEGGTELAITSEGEIGEVPETVTVEADQQAATFVLQASDAEAEGRITVTQGEVSFSATVSVVAGGATLVINEVDANQPGSDADEFVELRNGTARAVPLAGLQLLLINGNGNRPYRTFDLDEAGEELPPQSYLVVAAQTVQVPEGVMTLRFDLPNNGLIQNGPDGVLLWDSVASEPVDGMAYEAPVGPVDMDGVEVPVTEGTATPDDPDDGSLCRLPDGEDTDDAAADWGICATPTPGARNQ